MYPRHPPRFSYQGPVTRQVSLLLCSWRKAIGRPLTGRCRHCPVAGPFSAPRFVRFRGRPAPAWAPGVRVVACPPLRCSGRKAGKRGAQGQGKRNQNAIKRNSGVTVVQRAVLEMVTLTAALQLRSTGHLTHYRRCSNFTPIYAHAPCKSLYINERWAPDAFPIVPDYSCAPRAAISEGSQN